MACPGLFCHAVRRLAVCFISSLMMMAQPQALEKLARGVSSPAFPVVHE